MNRRTQTLNNETWTRSQSFFAHNLHIALQPRGLQHIVKLLGQIPSYIDALFGFLTALTNDSVVPDSCLVFVAQHIDLIRRLDPYKYLLELDF